MGHVKSAKALIAEVQRIYEGADLSKRDLTQSERTEVEGLLLETKQMQSIENLGRELGAGMPEFVRGDGSPFGHAVGAHVSPGEAFTASKGYKSIKSASTRGQTWSSGLVDVGPVGLQAKGTLLESPGGGGGALVPVPQVVGGVVDTLFRPLVLEDLAPQRADDLEPGPLHHAGHRHVGRCGCR